MNGLSATNARQVLRRVRKAAQIGVLANNFVEVWRSVLGGRHLHQLRLRNGLSIGAPSNVQLWNHFNDIWLDRAYTPADFEIPLHGTVVDIGANIGIFSLLAAQRATRVLSFEPFAPTFKWLSRNIETNRLGGTVRPFNLAVGGTGGARTFHVQPESTSNSFFAESGSQAVNVECTTLGSIVDKYCDGRCDFLKMDCEGAEYEILLGASDALLRSVRQIAIEVHEIDGVHTRADLDRRLVGAGFTVQCQSVQGCIIMRAQNRSYEVR